MLSSDSVLTWSNISKRFGRRTVLDGVSGTLPPGQIIVVAGANGSGKSTFLKIAAGLISADRGEVTRPAARHIGYCAPAMELYGELTGLENLQFFADVSGIDVRRCDELLALVGLTKSASKLYSSYSSGMKQRLKLAFALLHNPSLLILDEPTIALDSAGVGVVNAIIDRHRKSGGSALIASNDPDEVERWADKRLELGTSA
jgi:ABC-type multidrug transport system ATPase subunit